MRPLVGLSGVTSGSGTGSRLRRTVRTKKERLVSLARGTVANELQTGDVFFTEC